MLVPYGSESTSKTWGLAEGSSCRSTPALCAPDLCDRLGRAYPQVEVDREAIFVRDGRVWTSAGVTTGIDMALAMVEEDHGRRTADSIAAHLVVYARRPGFQSQFSEVLVAQSSASD